MKLSKTDKLIKALEANRDGPGISTKVLAHRTGLANVRATVDRLRNEGFRIFLNTRINKRTGRKQRFYRWAS